MGVAALALLVTVAPARANVLGTSHHITYVRTKSKFFSDQENTPANASCPSGEEITGGGSEVDGNEDKSYIWWSWSDTGTEWLSNLWHTTMDESKVVGWAICTDRVSDVQRYIDTAPVGAGPTPKVIKSHCDFGAPLSGGGYAGNSATDSWINSSLPIDTADDTDSKPDDGWSLHLFARSGASASQATLATICSTGKTPKYETASHTSSGTTVLHASCTGKRVIVGGGASASEPAGQAHLVYSRPADDKDDKDKIPDDRWEVEFANPNHTAQTFTAWAVCQ